jgi:RNA polymerase sigma-70 factor, ECF subfamily
LAGIESLKSVVVTLARQREVADLRSIDLSDRERAWRELYAQYFDSIYRLVCRFGVPMTDVEDITQSVFVRAHKRVQEVAEVRDVGAWLRGIAVRAVAEHLRWRRVRRVKQWLVRASAETQAVRTPEAQAASAQAERLVGEVLAEMSGKLRSALVLLDIEECSLEEAAQILGIPLNTVRSRRRLAREQFERLWTARTGSGDA